MKTTISTNSIASGRITVGDIQQSDLQASLFHTAASHAINLSTLTGEHMSSSERQNTWGLLPDEFLPEWLDE